MIDLNVELIEFQLLYSSLFFVNFAEYWSAIFYVQVLKNGCSFTVTEVEKSQKVSKLTQ